MIALKINETDFEILRLLVKRQNKPTPLSYLVKESKELSSKSYQYVSNRLKIMEGKIIEVKGTHPKCLMIKPSALNAVNIYVVAVVQLDDFFRGEVVDF